MNWTALFLFVFGFIEGGIRDDTVVPARASFDPLLFGSIFSPRQRRIC